jgi:hypothetical protein
VRNEGYIASGMEAYKKITREEFMAFFRDDEKLIELTVDDRLEIFNTILVGSSDVTVKLFNELLGDYNVADLSILQSEVDS